MVSHVGSGRACRTSPQCSQSAPAGLSGTILNNPGRNCGFPVPMFLPHPTPSPYHTFSPPPTPHKNYNRRYDRLHRQHWIPTRHAKLPVCAAQFKTMEQQQAPLCGNKSKNCNLTRAQAIAHWALLTEEIRKSARLRRASKIPKHNYALQNAIDDPSNIARGTWWAKNNAKATVGADAERKHSRTSMVG